MMSNTIEIHTGDKINKRVKSVVKIVTENKCIQLKAYGNAVSKLVSVLEISKRVLGQNLNIKDLHIYIAIDSIYKKVSISTGKQQKFDETELGTKLDENDGFKDIKKRYKEAEMTVIISLECLENINDTDKSWTHDRIVFNN